MSSLESPPENKTSMTGIDLRKADAAYKPFPSFAEWSARCVVDTSRWDRYTAELKKRRESSGELLPRALEIVKRAAAVDTGAIEGLYETDRGFTFTVAMESAHWEAALEQKGPNVKALFESQLQAYDYVLDLATQQVPIAEAWVRKLHAEICRSQETYSVWTEIGPQEQPLPKGEYKHLPNHVIRADGEINSYAPVDMTAPEMYRLCQELRSEAFLSAHPILQAAYAHYAFVVIHPFADGNGRVARALASVFTYRSQSVPLLILVDTRKQYYSSLASADSGDYQLFSDFILERSLDAIRLVNESLRAAAAPTVEDSLAVLKGLYMTKGGYTQVEVDEAGFKLFDMFQEQIINKLKEISVDGILRVSASYPDEAHSFIQVGYRVPITKHPRNLTLWLNSGPPANAQIILHFALEVPKDCGREDDLLIKSLDTGEMFEARITELIPVPTSALQMRISVWVQKVIRQALQELATLAGHSLTN